jgi:hypothetical protein
MNQERISLTMAPGGENNRGMEIIGRMPIMGEGFTAKDIGGLGMLFRKQHENIEVLNLNELSGNEIIQNLKKEDQGRVLVIRNWTEISGFDTNEIYNECVQDEWDAEYLDPNKYRIEIVDGKEVKIRGKRMNKRARKNICWAYNMEQNPAVYEGKGRIVDVLKRPILNAAVEKLKKQISNGLIVIGSKTKVEINVIEGNRYYNLKNTGIGYHGDTERVVVICLTIGGGGNYPMCWQWFNDAMPVGNNINIGLNDGDVYIMSEKAVGADWKLRSKYTIRHAAGAKKYLSLRRWEMKREAYEKKKAEKEAKRAEKEAEKETKRAEKEAEKETKRAEKEAEKEAK